MTLSNACVAQSVARVPGKDEVTGSIPVAGSSLEIPMMIPVPFDSACRIVAALHCGAPVEGPHQVATVHGPDGVMVELPLRGFLAGHGPQFSSDLGSLPGYVRHEVRIVDPSPPSMETP